jgi:hypothetical protein
MYTDQSGYRCTGLNGSGARRAWLVVPSDESPLTKIAFGFSFTSFLEQYTAESCEKAPIRIYSH